MFAIMSSTKIAQMVLFHWTNWRPELKIEISLNSISLINGQNSKLIYRNVPHNVVFPPALKKGMVKFPGKGTLSTWQQAKRALLNARRQAERAFLMHRDRLRGHFKPKLEIEYDIAK